MNKNFLFISIVFFIVFQTLSFSVYAAEKNDTTLKYDIQFEKLTGTNDAKELNYYKKTLCSYFNEILKKEHLLTLKSSEIDFNNEALIKGFKVHNGFTDYTLGPTYENIIKSIPNYDWRILIMSEKTAVYTVIKHCSDSDCKKFHFGKDWCINCCVVSKSHGKFGSPDVMAIGTYALYDGAETNLNKHIKAKKDDEIKVIFADIGYSETEYHYYGVCGIVFVNDTAKYVYSLGGIGFYDLVESAPEYVKKLLEICSSKMYYNTQNSTYGCKDIKELFDYNFTMTLIRIYETYALY